MYLELEDVLSLPTRKKRVAVSQELDCLLEPLYVSALNAVAQAHLS